MARSQKESTEYRGLWKGLISFGLVNIPIQIISAKEQEDLHFTLLDPSNLAPIGYKYYNKVTGEEVPRRKTVKAYKNGPNSYVIMTEADFKTANPKATQTIEIESFVDLKEIDPVFYERAYYLMPTKGGEKAYQLFCEALNKSKKVAIAKIVLYTKQHLVAIIPRGNYLLLELLHFAEDVKELRELDSKKAPGPMPKMMGKEVEMARRLIQDMTSTWRPDDYKDTYREDILSQVKAKVKAGKATDITQEIAVSSESSPTNVVDLMPLLRKSLAAKKSRSRRA